MKKAAHEAKKETTAARRYGGRAMTKLTSLS